MHAEGKEQRFQEETHLVYLSKSLEASEQGQD